ncbi:MAG TPA: hypothetical protein VG498_01680 [Terriglobales bacterium]|nr:hypothetical protein [Terriglobales bacterium]
MWTKIGLLLLVITTVSTQSSASKDWELVRSVPNGFGGTLDLALVPVARERDREYYNRVADAVCGSRTTCMVNFWTNRAHIPDTKSGWISVRDLAVMTASYERHPSYKEPSLHLACWLYSTKAVGEAAKCEYQPGAKRPPDK